LDIGETKGFLEGAEVQVFKRCVLVCDNYFGDPLFIPVLGSGFALFSYSAMDGFFA